MRFEIGDKVTCKHFTYGKVGTITEAHPRTGGYKSNYYRVEAEGEGNYHYYEEDLELVEAPAQGYLDLFI